MHCHLSDLRIAAWALGTLWTAFLGVFAAGAANPMFGQPLQSNGGFEQNLTNWQVRAGRPSTPLRGLPGSPRSGLRFFHGGLRPGGDAVVSQEIDLLAAGFTAADVDNGASLEAEAWLKNLFPAGTFDDQVYYRVGFLNAAGEELYAVRCMVAADSVWLQRSLLAQLPVGTRKLQIDIVGQHRQGDDNDSLADDIVVRLRENIGPAPPRFSKLPMLQDVRTNAMSLLWETLGNYGVNAVEWGRSNVSENTLTAIETLQIDTAHFVHRATIPGLETETTYQYRVRAGPRTTATYSFRTAPHRDTPFAVAWWGDNHDGTTTLRAHISNLLAHAPDLICVAGDMVNSGNLLNEWHEYWFKPLEHLNCAQTRPVLYARGNHDGEHALAYAYSKLPGNEAWFAFDYGNTRFIFLDSETPTGFSPEQFDWLRAELNRPETQRAAFRVVCFHRPPYVNLWNGGGHTGESWVQSDWVPLFEQRNVDLVIGGHAHNYNRGAQRGVTYVVSGGGGGTLDIERVAFWPLFTVEYSRYHYNLMQVEGEILTWQTFDRNNQLLDEFTLRSRVPSVQWQVTAPINGVLSLTLSGKPGARYVLEGSTNLQHWSAVATNTIPLTGPPTSTNRMALDSAGRFFRARAPQ